MKRKRITKQERKDTHVQKTILVLRKHTSILFIAKKSEGMREKTINSYDEHYNFFIKWLEKYHSDLQYIDELNPSIVREYIVYMKEDHFNFKIKTQGLAPQTINARIRFLKNFYNLLFNEGQLQMNILEQVKLLKTDDTPFEALTSEEMNNLFNTPDRQFFSSKL